MLRESECGGRVKVDRREGYAEGEEWCEWRVCAGKDRGLTTHLMRNTQSYSLPRDLSQLLESS